MPKDLLCVVGAGERPSHALAQGLALASDYRASCQFVALVPGPPKLANIFGAQFVDDLISQANGRASKDAVAVSASIAEQAKGRGIEAAISTETRSLAEAAAAIEKSARCYDLTVIDRPESFVDVSAAIFETVLFGSGRPVLVAVPGRNPARIKRVLLAWDGSAHAVRALAAALALFPGLEEVIVLTVVGEKNLDELVPGSDIAAHIRRHAVKTAVACIDLDPPAEDAGAGILKFAKAKQAELIVMGGYGHSRFRELVLGGVTEYLSRKSDVPLLLVH